MRQMILVILCVAVISGAAMAETEVSITCDFCDEAIDPKNYTRYHYEFRQMEARSGSVPKVIGTDYRFCGKPCTLRHLLKDQGQILRDSWERPPKGRGISYRYICAVCGYVKWEPHKADKMYCGRCANDKKTNPMLYAGEYDEKDYSWYMSTTPFDDSDDTIYYFENIEEIEKMVEEFQITVIGE